MKRRALEMAKEYDGAQQVHIMGVHIIGRLWHHQATLFGRLSFIGVTSMNCISSINILIFLVQ